MLLDVGNLRQQSSPQVCGGVGWEPPLVQTSLTPHGNLDRTYLLKFRGPVRVIYSKVHFVLRLIIHPVSGPHGHLPYVTLVGLGDVSIGGLKIIPAGFI